MPDKSSEHRFMEAVLVIHQRNKRKITVLQVRWETRRILKIYILFHGIFSSTNVEIQIMKTLASILNIIHYSLKKAPDPGEIISPALYRKLTQNNTSTFEDTRSLKSDIMRKLAV